MPGEIDVVVAAAGRLVVVGERQLAFGHGKRDRQPARRIGVAEQHVGDGVAALLARIPRVEDRADAIEPRRHRDRAAADEHDDDGLCRSRRTRSDQLLLASRQARACARSRNSPSSTPATTIGDVALPRERDGLVDLRAALSSVDAGVPDQLQPRVAGALEVLEPDRGATSPAPSATSAIRVPYDCFFQLSIDERVVEIEAIAVVAFDADAPHACRRRDDRPGPARRIPVERNAAARRVERPAEVDARIDARQPRRAFEAVLSKYSPQSPTATRAPTAGAGTPDGTVTNSRTSRPGPGRVVDVATAGTSCSRMPSRIETLSTARPAVAAEPRLVGVGADHRDRARCVFASGSVLPIVLQQHDRLRAPPRAPARDARRCRSHAAAASASTYGCSNSPSSNLTRSTRATAASITADGNQSALQRVEVRPLLSVRRLKHDVEPGLERVLRRYGRVRLGHVQHGRAAGGRRVGDDEPSEAPVALQDVVQQARDSASPAIRPRSCRRS